MNCSLIGMINHLNGLGLPLVSVECLPTPVENEPSEQDDTLKEDIMTQEVPQGILDGTWRPSSIKKAFLTERSY